MTAIETVSELPLDALIEMCIYQRGLAMTAKAHDAILAALRELRQMRGERNKVCEHGNWRDPNCPECFPHQCSACQGTGIERRVDWEGTPIDDVLCPDCTRSAP